jgi:hypothetical protein
VDTIIKLVIVGVIIAAATTTFLVWRHGVVEEGVQEQIVADAPVMSHCKNDFNTSDPKACASALVQRLADATKAIEQNAAFADKLKVANDAADAAAQEGARIKANADAVLAKAAATSKTTQVALDRYMAILNAPPEPRTATSCEKGQAIIHELLVRP